MQSVLPESKENRTRKTDDTVKTKETEERRRNHEETMTFEDKKRQCPNICTQNQKHYYKQLTKKITDEDHK